VKPRIWTVQNSVEGLGAFASVLLERAHVMSCRADGGASLPSPGEMDGLVVLGGPASAYDDAVPVRAQLGLIASVLAAGKPLLGVCLGAQLLAKAAGARVYPTDTPEHGVSAVRLTPAARTDALFGGRTAPGTRAVFQWHGDTFDLPEGATLLAEGDRCRNQAFRIGRAWGVQFHVEAGVAEVRHWLEGAERAVYDADITRYGLDRRRLLQGLAEAEASQRPLAQSLARAFVAEIEGA
jgi:GMP synthase (glutamine-hydrolysing)